MAENPYIVLDFETGGLNGAKHAITQIGMLCIDGVTLQEVGRYESYITPYHFEYDQKALDYTGTTVQLLNLKGKPLQQVGEEVFNLVKEWHKKTSNTHTKKPILIGHNIKFDISFLQQLFHLCKKDLSSCFEGQKDFHGNFYPGYIDTMYLSKLALGDDPEFTSYQLGKCCEKMEVSLVDAHNALGDVIGTKELSIKFVNRLRNDSTNVQGFKKIRQRDHFHFQI